MVELFIAVALLGAVMLGFAVMECFLIMLETLAEQARRRRDKNG